MRLWRRALASLAAAAACWLPLAARAGEPRVEIDTNAGRIVIELYPARAPATVANFLDYVRGGHYDGTVFHRVEKGFVAQAGGYTLELQEKPTRAPIPLESRNGLTNQRGTVAMARHAAPDSARAQFYFNLADNPHLDHPQPDGHGYAVFGRVTEGLSVLGTIERQPTVASGPFSHLPAEPILIQSARVLD
jgi:peptidyl-prolyl cis-trans isomerase A (cyclophilin A)